MEQNKVSQAPTQQFSISEKQNLFKFAQNLKNKKEVEGSKNDFNFLVK